jgi:multidrug efflux system membrane fusion protein
MVHRGDPTGGRRLRATSFHLLIAIATAVGATAGRAQPAQPGGGSRATVPVSVGKVVRKDVPIWLNALGTVQAFYSVQLRSKVDGTLQQVAVTEGQEVKQGDLLAVIDPRPYQAALSAAQAKKQQDEADLANAQNDLARYTTLARQDHASRQQVDTQQALVRRLTAVIAGDAAQVDAAQLNLSYCYITAPFSGRVGLRTVDPGNFVRASEATSLMPLAQLKPIAVTFTVPQEELPRVQAGLQQGRPAVVAYGSDNHSELAKGTLLTVDNSVDSTTGTIKLKATFANDAGTLWPGQFVNTRVLVGTDPDALTVPSAAIMHGQDRQYVYLLKPDQTVTVRTVQIIRDNGSVAVLASGLEPADQVVTDGQSRLQEGSHVTIVGGQPKQAANPSPAGG